jgi:ribosomal protein L11 methyltransferase
MVRLGNSVLALDGDPSSVADAVRIRDALDPLMIEEALWHLQAFDLSPIGPMRRREIAEEDWAHGWKEHFHPLRIGRVVIKPSWRGWDEQPDELVIELDPGMAFGTGLHPTTKLMIEALQERVKPGMQVLDLGTGSGILAIPAAMLGAEVTGLDVSEVAVQVARDNVAANGLTDHISMEQGSIEGAAGQQFDLILANITASVLIDLAEKLVDALRPGAELLASGIIDERVEQVRAAFRDAGLQIAGGKQDGDWWLVVARRTA